MKASMKWLVGVTLLGVVSAFVALVPATVLLAAGDEQPATKAPRATTQVEPPAAPAQPAANDADDDQAAKPGEDDEAAAGASAGGETPQSYIEKANAELLKLRQLPADSKEYSKPIIAAYKLIAHGFHQFPRDPALTVAYAAMKPVQLFRHFGWRIQGFLIHSPLDYRRYKNTVRRSYEQWRLTDNRAGMFWIRWFTDTPEDAQYDVQNGKFANSKEFPLFPNGEKMQHFLVGDAYTEMENVTQALEANVVKRQEDFSFNWDLRGGFSNWALGAEAGFTQPADESPVKRVGRSEGILLAAGYRAWLGWSKIFCAYNFNSFFKVRSRFNEGKAFTELAAMIKQWTLPDLFKLWHKQDSKQMLDGPNFIKSSQADLLASLAYLEELNNNQFAKGDENPAGRWFDYNVMKPWSGRIANMINEMRAMLTSAVSLEDSWSRSKSTVNLAGFFDNPPPDLTIFLPTKVTSNEKLVRYTNLFQRAEIRGAMHKEFGVDLRHLVNPMQNADLVNLEMNPDWQPTNDPGEWRDYTMHGLFPDAQNRDGLLKGIYTMVNSRSGALSSGTVWGLVYGTLFWTN